MSRKEREVKSSGTGRCLRTLKNDAKCEEGNDGTESKREGEEVNED